jgi:hypothetical protein
VLKLERASSTVLAHRAKPLKLAEQERIGLNQLVRVEVKGLHAAP